MTNKRGNNEAEMRERLHALADKARADAKSLTIAELEEICELVAVLVPED